MQKQGPIVVIDSGLGGLTVVKALRSVLPAEDIVYFGDTARLPYGSKTAATVSAFVKQIIAYLTPLDPRHVVIACNTATALALPGVKAAFPSLSVSGVIEPGSKAAVVAAGARQVPTIGVIATEATVRSKAYERAIHRRRNHARILLRPTPLLVPIIEEGRGPDDPLVRLALEQYLKPLVRHRIDVLVLGCTHYPVYRPLIQEMVGHKVRVIDSAEQCADDVARRLSGAGPFRETPAASSESFESPSVGGGVEGSAGAKIVSEGPSQVEHWQRGTLRCFVTDDPARFKRLAPRFLGVEIDTPAWVSPDDLFNLPSRDVPLSVPA
jgi:glutamate racemase